MLVDCVWNKIYLLPVIMHKVSLIFWCMPSSCVHAEPFDCIHLYPPCINVHNALLLWCFLELITLNSCWHDFAICSQGYKITKQLRGHHNEVSIYKVRNPSHCVSLLGVWGRWEGLSKADLGQWLGPRPSLRAWHDFLYWNLLYIKL